MPSATPDHEHDAVDSSDTERQSVAQDKGLFRAELAARQTDGLGTVILASPPGLRVYGCLILASLAVTIAALVAVSLKETAQASGILMPVGGEVRVEAPITGTLLALNTTLGARVAIGDPLAIVASDRVTGEGDDLTPVLLGSLTAQKRELLQRRSTIEAAYAADIDELDARARGARADVESNQRQQELLTQRRSMAVAQVEQMRSLVEKGYGAAIELSRRQETLLLASQDVESAAARIEASQSTARELAARRRSVAARRDSELSALLQNAADIDIRAATTNSEGTRTIRAPLTGRVAALTGRIGQRVAQGTAVMTIIPPGSELEVELAASPQSVQNFRAGQPVDLQIEAYPFQRYGVLAGRVISVSGAAVPAQQTETDVAAPAVYSVKVKLLETREGLLARGFDLRPGMVVDGVAVARATPLWRIVFGPLFGLPADK